jgi:hypothetical protein
VSKHWNLRKDTVEAKPSRIRREPVPAEKPASLDKVLWQSREWEIGLAIAGMILFAIAISSLSIGLSAITG